jgi:zinc resistance-associated protein
MKTGLSAIALVAALTLAPFIGGSFAVADNSAQREEHGERFTPEDRAAFLDARIAALKAGLQLNAEQEKNWGPLESAMRDLARQRAERFAAWRERRDNQDGGAEISPVDRIARASERLSARAADLQKLAAAAKPLYDSLDDGQKRRFAVLFHGSMGRGQGRHWRRDG